MGDERWHHCPTVELRGVSQRAHLSKMICGFFQPLALWYFSPTALNSGRHVFSRFIKAPPRHH